MNGGVANRLGWSTQVERGGTVCCGGGGTVCKCWHVRERSHVQIKQLTTGGGGGAVELPVHRRPKVAVLSIGAVGGWCGVVWCGEGRGGEGAVVVVWVVVGVGVCVWGGWGWGGGGEVQLPVTGDQRWQRCPQVRCV